MTLSITYTQPNNALHYAERRALFIVMLCAVMLSVVMVNVDMLSVVAPVRTL